MRIPVLFGLISLLSQYLRAQTSESNTRSAGITISLPWVNSYRLYDHEKRSPESITGFTGFGAAGFYKKDKNKYSLNAGITGDLPAPIGPFDYGHEGTRVNIASIFVEALYHRKLIWRFNIIGGINYNTYRFKLVSYVDSIPYYTTYDNTAGIAIGTEYRSGKRLSVALFYRPALFYFDQKQYMHLLSLDARFDITFWRNK